MVLNMISTTTVGDHCFGVFPPRKRDRTLVETAVDRQVMRYPKNEKARDTIQQRYTTLKGKGRREAGSTTGGEEERSRK